MKRLEEEYREYNNTWWKATLFLLILGITLKYC